MTTPLTAEEAQALLLAIMQTESEERWCAGWYMGLEAILWAESGRAGATPAYSAMRKLAAIAGGWWVRGDTFIPLATWEAKYATVAHYYEPPPGGGGDAR